MRIVPLNTNLGYHHLRKVKSAAAVEANMLIRKYRWWRLISGVCENRGLPTDV